MHHRKTLSAAIALTLCHTAFAQAQETELEPVVVTANRVATTANETLASVTVITRKDIEQQQAQSVPDLLRGVPGIQLSSNGGPGKTTSLYLRGTNDSHTLILVDGVRIGSATSGGAPLQDIPMEQIERIEIVRGPRASLYGSDAIGGVVQIFTKKGVQSPSFSIGGGSRGTYEASAAGGFGDANTWLNLGASGFSTHGVNVKPSGNEPDADGYTRGTINVRTGIRLNEKLDTDLQAMHTAGRNEYDGNPNVTTLEQDLYAGNLRYVANDLYTSRLRVAQNTDASKNYKDDVYRSRFDTRRSQASWQNEITVAKGHQLVAGTDYQYDEVISSTAYARTKRTNKAVFGQYLADFNSIDLQLAARHDENEQFGHHNTGSVAAGYTFSPALRVFASHGTAFRAPSFNDLYWPGSENPDLQPEKSRSSELGATGKSTALDWKASVFRTRISNLIAWAAAPTVSDPYRWVPSNVAKASINGVELSASRSFGNTKLAATTTWIDPRDRSGGDNDGHLLVRRARQTARLDADHTLGAWSFGASINGVGKRYDDLANTTKLGGYATLDLRTEYAFNPAWRVQARLENALDKQYETAGGYHQPGIGAYLTLRYAPK